MALCAVPTACTCRFGITRAHLEEDAGKNVHGGADSLSGSSHTLVDYNRAGAAATGQSGAHGCLVFKMDISRCRWCKPPMGAGVLPTLGFKPLVSCARTRWHLVAELPCMQLSCTQVFVASLGSVFAAAAIAAHSRSHVKIHPMSTRTFACVPHKRRSPVCDSQV
jgi:hypothetical protein